MNKKHLNIGLIVLLIAIWGSVIYRYFGSKKTTDKNTLAITIPENYKDYYTVAKDTFQLELINKNPFKIAKQIKRLKPPNKQVVVKKNKPIKKLVKTSITWPEITYHGFVKGERKSTKLILLKINKKLYRKREKEAIGEISLVKAYEDSLIVSLNKNKKIIYKIHD
ncbi:hypothetical protein D7030_08375 [Flavobacteriaceae bacterium AU392]|nr:hypothetical protein D1817_00040 [Flavobacteriaceae bacterium]RKM85134.1 hypothetical protein D7030_08375 [Flavobacteriaceae bacterium AU392]